MRCRALRREKCEAFGAGHRNDHFSACNEPAIARRTLAGSVHAANAVGVLARSCGLAHLTGGNAMRKHSPYVLSFVVCGFAAGALAGCQSDGNGSVEVGITSSGLASATPSAGADGVPIGPRLLLTVTRVDVHVAGFDDPTDDPPAGRPIGSIPPGEGGGWVTVFAGVASVDLLKAASVETFLGSTAAPAGKVTQIRLVLSEATWVDGAVIAPVVCPSCTQTGLKIVTMGKLVIPAGGTLHVTLDFDQAHSLQATADGYRLDPVV